MPRTRRVRGSTSADRPEHPAEEPQRDEPQHRGAWVDAHARVATESFPGGPYDRSLLTGYENHVAVDIWLGRDRGPLEVYSHGNKLKDWVQQINPIPPYIVEVIINSGLSSLLKCSHTTIDSALVSAFVERWHRETSSFHLPFGEMTVTLDDVSCLLHLPVEGAFFSDPEMDDNTAISYLQDLLGVSHAEATVQVKYMRGANMSFWWLQKVYNGACETHNWVVASRAFIMLLLGCTILTNKSQTAMEIKYLDLVRDFDHCRSWSWASIALSVLYQNLTDASMSTSRQIGGYMTLLQAWILEHFPTICTRKERRGYTEEDCRARRWLPKRGTGELLHFRRALDTLNPVNVSWTPYTDHRPYVPLQELSLFSGYIRFCSITVPHLPERVLRQFGYEQVVPPPPMQVPSTDVLDNRWKWYRRHSVINTICPVPTEFPYTCTISYLEWFYSISHPCLIPLDSEGNIQVPPTGSVEEAEQTHSASFNDGYFDTKKMLNKIAVIVEEMAYKELCVGPTTHCGDIKRLQRILQFGTDAGPSSSRDVYDISSSEE